MKEEGDLLRKVGTDNPFGVPKGYFEGLTEKVMNNLPEHEVMTSSVKSITWWDRVKPWTYMAAMFVGAALIIRIASTHITTSAENAAEESEIEYISAAVDNSMLDDYSLYVYMTTDAEAE